MKVWSISHYCESMLLVPLLVVGALGLVWLFWRLRHRDLLKAANQFPGPKALPLLGNAMMFVGISGQAMVGMIKDLMVEYGEVVKFWLGPDLNIVISNPEELKSQEATAKIASYLLLMMAYHPECQEKLYNEVKSVIGDSDRDITDDDLKQMPYLDMAFKEVIRLFPIGAMLQRTVPEDIPLKKGFLPAGCSLVIPIYHLHRDTRFWQNPDAFEPERFNPENMERGYTNAYIPFSLGPMDCLGRHFGTKLVKTICSRVIREFELTSLNSYKDLELVFNISVETPNGYFVKMKRRSN